MTRQTNARIAGFTFLFYIATGITSMILSSRAMSGDCRVVEGVNGATSIPRTLGLLWLATTTGAHAPSPESTQALGAFLIRGSPTVSATFFAVGSTLFSWLLLRGRMIPSQLAWLGVAASVLLVVVLPFQIGGLFGGLIGWLPWLPMLVFEVWLALWFLVKGVATPVPR